MLLTEFMLRILASVFFGFVIGLERQLTGHMAGIRINILVSLGTSIFVLFSLLMGAPDATRIAAQIVTGVGFLCSGIIFKDGVNVRGLNTAATIWCTAAIGVLTSSGELSFALAATGLLLLVNIVFRHVASVIKPLECFDEREQYYKISVSCPEEKETLVRSILMKHIDHTRFTLLNLESIDTSPTSVEIEATLLCAGRRRDNVAEKLVRLVSLEKGVNQVGWEVI